MRKREFSYAHAHDMHELYQPKSKDNRNNLLLEPKPAGDAIETTCATKKKKFVTTNIPSTIQLKSIGSFNFIVRGFFISVRFVYFCLFVSFVDLVLY